MNYALDLRALRHGPLTDSAMEFSSPAPAHRRARRATPNSPLGFTPLPAPWRSGYAAACKAVYTGSIPVGAFRSGLRDLA